MDVRVPLEDPYGVWEAGEDEPVYVGEKEREGGGGERAVFPAPIYPSLTTNIPAPVMRFHDLDFVFGEGDGERAELYPKHANVLEYLERYYEEKVEKVAGEKDKGWGEVYWGWKVRKVERLGEEEGRSEGLGRWRVLAEDVSSFPGSGLKEGYYDAIVVAAGRYAVPHIPDIPGLREWVHHAGGKVEHSRDFRESEDRYVGRKVLVIGSSFSADDIARLLAPMVQLPILQSMRSPPPPLTDSQDGQALQGVLPVPAISHITLDPPLVHFHPYLPTASDPFPSPHPPIPAPDIILFATGYLLTAPYLPPHISKISKRGTYISDLVLHLMSKSDPTLAWVGIPFRVLPFSIVAGQGAVLGRVWSGVVGLGEVEEEADVLARKWSGREKDGGGGGGGGREKRGAVAMGVGDGGVGIRGMERAAESW